MVDDLDDGLHKLAAKGRPAGAELIRRRKEIRHMISEFVHQTDSNGGQQRIPRILELGATLLQRIRSEEKR